MATHSRFLAWEIPWTREAWRATVREVSKESDVSQRLKQHQQMLNLHFGDKTGVEEFSFIMSIIHFIPQYYHNRFLRAKTSLYFSIHSVNKII